MIYLSFLGFECSNEKDTLMNICLKSYDEYFEHFIENQEDLSDFIPFEFVKNDYILSTEKDYFFSRIDSSIINDYSEIIKYVCEIIDEKYITNNILVTINSSNTLDELTSLKYAIHNMFKEHYIKNGENFKDHFNLYSSLSSLPLNFLFKLAEKLETRLLDSEQKKDVEKYLFKIKSIENLKKAEEGSSFELKRTNPAHFASDDSKPDNISIEQDKSTSMRSDGNNVDLDVEKVNQAANTLKYNALISKINGKFNDLKMVIK